MFKTTAPVSVHIGVEPAMTGVSRFSEIRDNWKSVYIEFCLILACFLLFRHSYSKREDLKPNSIELQQFTFLLISASSYEHYSSSHEIIHREEGLARLVVNWRKLPPVQIIVEDKIYILSKINNSCLNQ